MTRYITRDQAQAMRTFATLDDLVAAYTTYFNDSYDNDPAKTFTEHEVREVCVELLAPSQAAAMGITIEETTHWVRGWGYVLT